MMPLNEDQLKSYIRCGKQGPFFNIVAFNYFPCLYLHPARINSVCPEKLWRQLIAYKQGREGLSNIILNNAGIASSYFYDFSQQYRLIATLPQDVFNKLLMYASVYIHFKKIASVIEKNELKKLKAYIDEPLYHLAMTKAAFVVGNLDLSFILQAKQGELIESIKVMKKTIVEKLFSFEPASLTKRLEFRFSPDEPLLFESHVEDKHRRSLWILLKKILVQDVYPQWKPFLS